MKPASIFFTASAIYIRGLPQIYAKTSEKYEVHFNIFHSADAKCASVATKEALASPRSAACSPNNLYSRFTSNIRKNERSTKFTTMFHCEP